MEPSFQQPPPPHTYYTNPPPQQPYSNQQPPPPSTSSHHYHAQPTSVPYIGAASSASTPLTTKTYGGDDYYEAHQINKARNAFAAAFVTSLFLFFFCTPFASCIPYLFVFKYRTNVVPEARRFGELARSIFWGLFGLNVLIIVCATLVGIIVAIQQRVAHDRRHH
ncbi:hypothetical protein C9374_005236 [Naegleria lovaniensis]|uniref:Transmembrane protein n=1 Tax=Naegleria lovaniensis TaxID=51637 RepID=A0AA88KNK2_NAELO|nr:uncharacterized protein C9374_005236 [Naegleria lovaniensis]KAG2382656.1 hypothetical protein C9374_005236 [Naegleria lovaniensis]